MLSGSVHFWWKDYLSWLSVTSPYAGSSSLLGSTGRPLSSVVFSSSLLGFLQSSAGAQYWLDVVPLDGGSPSASASQALGGGLRAFRAQFRVAAAEDSAHEARAMDAARALTAASAFSSVPLFAWHPHYGPLETQQDLGWEVGRHLLVGAAVMLVVLLFLLANLWAALCVVLLSAMVCLETVGLLALAGPGWALSPSSAMPTALYVPLSLGFFLPTMQAFLRCPGSRPHRARKALQKLGGVVVDYLAVLLLSVVLLAGARTPDLFATFASLSLLAGLGGFHGLAVWPLLLSHVGPSPQSITAGTDIVLSQRDSESDPVLVVAIGAAAAAASRSSSSTVGIAPATASMSQAASSPSSSHAPLPRMASTTVGDGVEMQAYRGDQHDSSSSSSRSHSQPQQQRGAWNPHDPAHQPQTRFAPPLNRTPQKPAKWM